MKITAENKCTILSISIERDLRNWIKLDLLNNNKLNSLVSNEILNKFKMKTEDAIDDDELINGADFGECLNILDQFRSKLNNESKLLFEDLKEPLISIKKVRDRSAHKNLLASDIDEMQAFIEKISDYQNTFLTVFHELDKFNKKDYNIELSLDDELETEDVIENNLPETEHQETGWIRRDKLMKKIDQTIKKNSVVVITGDGGIGKTSILLQKCHELKTSLNTYDEIKWFTFKTQSFSNNEIKELNKSFKSYNQFLETFSTDKNEDVQIKILLEYLTKKKCLLILDNLETILDQKITNFIEASHEIDHESKILITSREPIDSGVTIKIPSFDDKSAESLFRKYAQYLDLEFINKIKPSEIKKLTNLRENNPLGIKLSLDDVYNGTNVEKAFEPNKDFLSYSYNNLFEKLNTNSKKILEMFYFLDEEFTLTTICTYTQIEPDQIEQHIAELDKKRFLIRDLKDSGTEYFSLRSIIKSFLKKNNIFTDLYAQKKILSQYERLKIFKSNRKNNLKEIDKIKCDYDSFLKRKNSDDEAIVELLSINRYLIRRSKMITSIIRLTEINEKEKLRSEINLKDQQVIKDLSFLKKKHPNYCEVYRVEGIFYTKLGLIDEVKNSFQRSIDLQPDYPNLYTFYIQSLRSISQLEESIRVGKNALKLFPKDINIQYQVLPSLYFFDIYNDLTKELAYKNKLNAIDNKNKNIKFAKKLAKNSLEYHRRFSEYLISLDTHDNYVEAYENILTLAKNFKEFEDLDLIDLRTTQNTLKKGFNELSKLKNYFNTDTRYNNIIGLIDVFREKVEKYTSETKYEADQKFIEQFSTKKKEKQTYKIGDEVEGIFIGGDGWIDPKIGGFIKLNDGIIRDYDGYFKEKIFVHSSNFKGLIPYGTRLNFKISDHINHNKRKSLVAVDIMIKKN